jgi:hypothetical protein
MIDQCRPRPAARGSALHKRDGKVRQVNANPTAIEFLRSVNGRATAAEGIKNRIASKSPTGF